MIFGIGSDLCSISRLEQSLSRTPKLGPRLFHPNELGLSNQSLAARFAAKEAITKAIGDPRVLTFSEVEITKDALGKPSVAFHSGTRKRIESLGELRFHISLAHDAGVAMATVVVESK
jgi:holo-[acyl-carrier protein] synthase